MGLPEGTDRLQLAGRGWRAGNGLRQQAPGWSTLGRPHCVDNQSCPANKMYVTYKVTMMLTTVSNSAV